MTEPFVLKLECFYPLLIEQFGYHLSTYEAMYRCPSRLGAQTALI